MAETLDSLPEVLMISPPLIYRTFESEFLLHFRFLKPYESPLSLSDFLSAGHAAGATVLFATSVGPRIGPDILRHLPALRCIVNSTAGLNHIDIEECRRRGIALTYAGDVLAEDCADMAVALLIDVIRKVTAGDRYVKSGKWSVQGEYHLGNRLRGRRVGIVGLGHIGSKVAQRLAALGCIISYNSRKPKPSVPYPYYPDIYQLATSNNVLILCCTLTDQTRHLINKKVLSALGKEGIIINIARGAVVDEKELVRCLTEGEIAGAGMDVFENEPYISKELVSLDNVVVSPHAATATTESFRDLFELVKGNLLAFFSNKPLLSPIAEA